MNVVPIWLLIFKIPYVFVFFLGILLLVGIFMLCFAKKYKVKIINKLFDEFMLTLFVYLFGVMLLYCGKFFDLTIYLYTNPYDNLGSILYLLLIFIICGFFIFIMNKKFIFRGYNWLVSFVISFLLLPFIFLIPSYLLYSKDSVILSKFVMLESSSVKTTVDNLNIPFEDLEIKHDSIVITYNNDEYYNLYKTLEQDASLLFKLSRHLNDITYIVNGNKYIFKRDDINNIYGNVKNVTYKNILKRYEGIKNIYFGHVNDFDIIDKSEICMDRKQLIYEDDNNAYYVTCSDITKLYLVSGDKSYLLKDEIGTKVSLDLLFNSGLILNKEPL
ncbi:MAG: hypothetical protein RR847_02710 [Bacilli bacterium]